MLTPDDHTDGAVQWIRQAWKATADGGISKGYNLLTGQWAPSYPETSGYTIPTLLDYYEVTGLSCYRDLALRVAEYLLTVQVSGGIPDWRSLRSGRPMPVVFDTGQVIFGWLRAHEETGEERYSRAAVRAADWLAACQDAKGYWSEFQHLDTVKVIDTRVAWALLETFRMTSDSQHCRAAQSNLDWAMTQQNSSGWFRNCSFQTGVQPITHTIAYTAEGLLESGMLLEDDRYVEAAKLTADALLHRQGRDGSLRSSFDSGWNATSRSSCLTGNCQMARIWLRLHDLTGEHNYLDAAGKAIAFVAATQDLRIPDRNIRGGIKGSHPIYGSYERLKYPNWAAKFFVDAMLLWAKTGEVGSVSERAGQGGQLPTGQ